ncbi:hypothetical protein ABBQ38_002735 [Trebouxia sp. C0009 RCD-2024]
MSCSEPRLYTPKWYANCPLDHKQNPRCASSGMNYTVNDLEPQTLREIFRLTSSHQCAQLATCQKLWRTIASDDSLWQQWGQEDFAMERPTAPSGQLQDSWRCAYAAWHTHIGKYMIYSRRTILAWRNIERWTEKHHPIIAQSLGEPATEAQLNDAEEALGFKIPDSLRVIYRLHDGQKFDPYLPNQISCGLFGGYSFYDHHISVQFLSVDVAAATTTRLRVTNSSIDYGDALLVGWSSKKGLMLMDGGCQLRVGSYDDVGGWDAAPSGGNDAMLRWLEHYAEALHQRFACCQLEPLRPETRISLYPVKPPWQRVCVSWGVRVKAAAIFVPELSRPSNLHVPDTSYLFSYSVEMSLLPLDEQRERWSLTDGPFVRPTTSVQLQTRHWIMRDENGEITSEVTGAGVLGKFPILVPGGTPFVYQSCTQSQQCRSSMGGFFTFVEGTNQAPTGPLFDVQCPDFPLEMPDYIF